MILKKKKNMTKRDQPITFEYQNYPECTVVALEATLDDFKAQPVRINGQECINFKERTIKDCRGIDGCIYFHLGHIADTVMCDLIEKFQKLKKESKDWKPFGKLTLQQNKITI